MHYQKEPHAIEGMYWLSFKHPLEGIGRLQFTSNEMNIVGVWALRDYENKMFYERKTENVKGITEGNIFEKLDFILREVCGWKKEKWGIEKDCSVEWSGDDAEEMKKLMYSRINKIPKI